MGELSLEPLYGGKGGPVGAQNMRDSFKAISIKGREPSWYGQSDQRMTRGDDGMIDPIIKGDDDDMDAGGW
jgi:hypothetical protein